MGIGYRARQFWQALTEKPDPNDLAGARQVLTPSMMTLFEQMDASEQAHSLSIYQRLREQNEANQDLLVAALLHDVGKSRYPLRLWERVMIVLGKRTFPKWVQKWGQGEPHGWKRAFVIAEQHADWGAELAAGAGASPLSTAIIRRHQQLLDFQESHQEGDLSLEDHLLYKLQIIDNES